jgi:hypothetical protein
MSLKKMMSAAAIVGAFGFTAIGLGAGGVASAVPSPVIPGTPLPQEPYGQDGDVYWFGPEPYFRDGDVFYYGPGWYVPCCLNTTNDTIVWPGWYGPGIPAGLNVPPVNVTPPTLPTLSVGALPHL